LPDGASGILGQTACDDETQKPHIKHQDVSAELSDFHASWIGDYFNPTQETGRMESSRLVFDAESFAIAAICLVGITVLC
jgi:hypothetical protein